MVWPCPFCLAMFALVVDVAPADTVFLGIMQERN
ncbi:MAG: hypothetical protein RL563_663 [Pseudomonadota bacterium]